MDDTLTISAAPWGGQGEQVALLAASTRRRQRVRVIAQSNDPVRLSFLAVLLADAGIEAILFDTHTSMTEGSIGAIQRRLMVASEDEHRARRVLTEAGEA